MQLFISIIYNMPKKGLHSATYFYKHKNDIYDIFAMAEDYPWHIYDFLKNIVAWKQVIDFWCGTWKYLQKLASYAAHITGVDASEDQINIAKNIAQSNNNITYVVEDSGSFVASSDCTICFSCWVFGTMKDLTVREKVYNNFIQSLHPWTEVYFIENDVGWEFEEIRGNTIVWENNPTMQYNKRLESKGCKPIKYINTFFQFSSQQQAKSVFAQIWGDEVWKIIHSSIIQHKVVIYTVVV